MVQQTNGLKAPPATAPQAAAPALPLQIALTTSEGRVRTRNEDDWGTPDRASVPVALRKARGDLLIVADGMGGQAAGEVASRMTAEGVMKRYYASNDEPRAALRDAIRQTNTDICNAARNNNAQTGMGSTLVAVLFLPAQNRALLAHVGDSRIYRLRGNQIEQMTGDHSWVAEKLRSREITPEEASEHSLRHVLTRAMGAELSVQPEIREVDLFPGDRYLLCSDGLSNMVSPDEMRLELARGDMQDATNKLVALANERGGPDNITALAALYGHGDAVTSIIGRRQRKGLVIALAALIVIALAALSVFLFVRPPAPALPTPTAQSAAAETTIEATSQGLDPTLIPALTTTSTVSAEVLIGQAGAASEPAKETRTLIKSTPTTSAGPKPTPALKATTAPLAAPVLKGPDNGFTSQPEKIEFEWEKVQGATGYYIETRSDREGQKDWTRWNPSTADNKFTLYFVSNNNYFGTPGTLYTWRVVATNGDSKSESVSEERTFKFERDSGTQSQDAPSGTPSQDAPEPLPTPSATP